MNYIGYGSLEEFAGSVNKGEPVYGCLVKESVSGERGMRSDFVVALVSQPQGDRVHYFRCTLAVLQYVHNAPFNFDFEERRAHAEQAWDLMVEWLLEQGFSVRDGVVAMPRDFKYFEGWPKFLAWDKDAKRYYRR